MTWDSGGFVISHELVWYDTTLRQPAEWFRAMSWRTGLIVLAALFISFVVGALYGERDRRPNHSARIWRNL